ncbi:MAG: MgtC/SapB family protein [Bacteroidota bacterium]|nr:MgtC/SapB family protein [Bacteroidota bacterium]MDP3144663.1 MgtC/SapB family protein [Bacteroidota bacterium]MDP3556999.1 MgtC/SapB family protein [Bacteroidota bacterium]
MNFDYDFISENSVKLGVSLVLGALIGAEREYKGRNIGFRTIILITLGSTLFTILSFILGKDNEPARIASNIVTGVGFLGAGAIFREGASVRGMTTASLIWISAAIGMACGIAQYEFAILVTLITLVILLGFTGVQKFIDRYNQEKIYKISIDNNLDLKREIEKNMKVFKLKFEIVKQTKINESLKIEYEIRGADTAHANFTQYLTTTNVISFFEV